MGMLSAHLVCYIDDARRLLNLGMGRLCCHTSLSGLRCGVVNDSMQCQSA